MSSGRPGTAPKPSATRSPGLARWKAVSLERRAVHREPAVEEGAVELVDAVRYAVRGSEDVAVDSEAIDEEVEDLVCVGGPRNCNGAEDEEGSSSRPSSQRRPPRFGSRVECHPGPPFDGAPSARFVR